MQPDQNTPPSESPYDFILKDPAKQRGPLLGGNKIFMVLVGGVILIFLIIILSSVFSKKGPTNADRIIGLLAQNQEIIRVSTEAQQNLKDPNDSALASTTIVALTSQQVQFNNYLSKIGAKATAAQLASKMDNSTDTTLKNAIANNSYDSVFDSYLAKALADYQNNMQAVATTSSQDFLQVLRDAFASNKTLLQSPELTNPSSG